MKIKAKVNLINKNSALNASDRPYDGAEVVIIGVGTRPGWSTGDEPAAICYVKIGDKKELRAFCLCDLEITGDI